MPKILLSGYYGFDNAGDDAVLYGIIFSLHRLNPKIEITVLSNKPETTRELFKIKAYNRWNIKEVIAQIKQADLVILGGGTLLQDRTSPKSPLYYLGITLLAKILKKPVVYYGQGFGPIIHRFNKRLIKSIVNKVDFLTVRDKESGDELKDQYNIKCPIYLAADPALTIGQDEVNVEEGKEILNKYQIDFTKRIAFIAVRNWKNEEHFKKELAKVADYLHKLEIQVVFLAMQNPHDLAPSLDILQLMEETGSVIEEALNFKQILSVLSFGNLMIGMRLHALILAAIVNLPFIALSYDPKIDRFAESLGKKRIGKIEEIEAEQLIEQINEIITNEDEERKKLADNLESIVKKAYLSAELVTSYLNSRKL